MTQPFNIGFPFMIDGRGAVADVDPAEHVDQLIELALLTTPGERVNRPQFGIGLIASLFEPFDTARAALLELEIRAFLAEHFGDRIAVTTVAVSLVQSTVEITIGYGLAGYGPRLSRYVYDIPV